MKLEGLKDKHVSKSGLGWSNESGDTYTIPDESRINYLNKFCEEVSQWIKDPELYDIFYSKYSKKLSLMIYYPEIEIQNSLGDKRILKNLYTQLKFEFGTDNFMRLRYVKGIRTSLSYMERGSDYSHSHLKGLSAELTAFCLGKDTPMAKLKNLAPSLEELPDYVNMVYNTFDQYLHWESIEGAPYRYLEKITIHTTMKHFGIPVGTVFTQTPGFTQKQIIKAIIASKSKCLRLRQIGNVIEVHPKINKINEIMKGLYDKDYVKVGESYYEVNSNLLKLMNSLLEDSNVHQSAYGTSFYFKGKVLKTVELYPDTKIMSAGKIVNQLNSEEIKKIIQRIINQSFRNERIKIQSKPNDTPVSGYHQPGNVVTR